MLNCEATPPIVLSARLDQKAAFYAALVVCVGILLGGCSKTYTKDYAYEEATHRLLDGGVVGVTLSGTLMRIDSGRASVYQRGSPYYLLVSIQPSVGSRYRVVQTELQGKQDGRTWTPILGGLDFSVSDSTRLYTGSDSLKIPYQQYRVRLQIEVATAEERVVETVSLDLHTKYSEENGLAIVDRILSV